MMSVRLLIKYRVVQYIAVQSSTVQYSTFSWTCLITGTNSPLGVSIAMPEESRTWREVEVAR